MSHRLQNLIRAHSGVSGQFTLLIALCLLSMGCGTLKGGRGWGEDAIYPVQWKRIPTAALHAALDPATWVPATGAALFAIDDWDQKVSRWARENTPIFGSEETARNASDAILTALGAETLATALATPSGDKALDWSFAKLKGVAVEYGAVVATEGVTDLLQDATDRERPDDSGDTSFPSRHASRAFVYGALSNRNLKSIEMPPWARTSLQVSTTTAAAAVAWARVEGGRHYPSDVLAGACLGNFLGVFIHDAFMNLPEQNRLGFYLEPSPKGVWAAVSWEF